MRPGKQANQAYQRDPWTPHDSCALGAGRTAQSGPEPDSAAASALLSQDCASQRAETLCSTPYSTSPSWPNPLALADVKTGYLALEFPGLFPALNTFGAATFRRQPIQKDEDSGPHRLWNLAFLILAPSSKNAAAASGVAGLNRDRPGGPSLQLIKSHAHAALLRLPCSHRQRRASAHVLPGRGKVSSASRPRPTPCLVLSRMHAMPNAGGPNSSWSATPTHMDTNSPKLVNALKGHPAYLAISKKLRRTVDRLWKEAEAEAGRKGPSPPEPEELGPSPDSIGSFGAWPDDTLSRVVVQCACPSTVFLPSGSGSG
ncbi:hypothetical protein C8F01DRAFT_1088191 [Mycena amicta]|nr:hypothetical protein C8F01DRAFT_1088191 [Mycena amicta]